MTMNCTQKLVQRFLLMARMLDPFVMALTLATMEFAMPSGGASTPSTEPQIAGSEGVLNRLTGLAEASATRGELAK